MENNDEFNKFLENIGEDVRNCRNNPKITQQQLAEKIKVSLSTIKRIEEGKLKNPSIEKLFLIASATGRTFYCYLSDTDKKTESKLKDIKNSNIKHLIKCLIDSIYYKENPSEEPKNSQQALDKKEIKQMLTLIMDLI